MAIAMPSSPQTNLARLRLDERLTTMRRAVTQLKPPNSGWIAAIRKALGMTQTQLADRLGVGKASVADVERSEKDERIQLDTLKRVAAALECELVYALIP